MKMTIRILLSAYINFIILIQFAVAGPFGTIMGEELMNYAPHHTNIGGSLYAIIPRKLHSSFEFYVSDIPKEFGLCSIAGATKPFQNDKAGLTLQRNEFENIRAQINEKYKIEKNIDDSHEVYGMEMCTFEVKNEEFGKIRGYCLWVLHDSKQADNVKHIFMHFIDDVNMSKRIVLRFEYKNYYEYKKAQNKIDADSL